jgi:peptide/nickel transport system substrate-binding protein
MDLEKTTGCQESEPMINVWEELYTPTTIQENGYTRANWGKGTASFAPRAARKINVSSNGLTWTVQIRPGVRAPSGDEFTTADIMWWLRRKAHFNGTGAFGDGIVGWNPKNVKVLSKYQIQFTTPKPNPLALEGLANIFDNAVDSKVYIKHATPSDPWAANWANTHAAGYGPYQLVSFQPGDQAVFTANPNYWAGPPAIKKVILKEIPSSATQLELLQAGSINLTRGLTVQQFATAAKNPNLKVIRVPGTRRRADLWATPRSGAHCSC